ncbi:lysylphosphatidylglycerol synthase transmembrane domain-containing protein [Luteitalea pratensis]|nr:lysylphosphatidylglycerol synthase transmembrane domain-containing protein [Luteitalea pratensis]
MAGSAATKLSSINQPRRCPGRPASAMRPPFARARGRMVPSVTFRPPAAAAGAITMSPVPGRVRRASSFVLKLSISAGLLWVLFRQTDVGAVFGRLRQVEPGWIVLALLVHGALLLVSGWRWRRLLVTQNVHVSTWQLTVTCLVANFFNNFLPSNIGGDFVRIADTAGLTGSRTVATAVVLLDRVLGLIALFAIAASGSLMLRHALPGTGYLWILLVLGAVGAAVVISRPALVPWLLRPLTRVREDWVTERLGRLEDMLGRVGNDRSRLAKAFAGALVVQFLVVLFYLCVAWGLHIDLPLRDALVIVPVSLVIQLAPVSINGFGVREAVFSYLFRRLGHPVDAGLALSIAGAALLILASLPGGLVFLLRKEGLMVSAPSSDMQKEEV